jgi:sugar phosphate isomerase/epimerase
VPCMTTDYASSTLSPEPYLRRLAAAGFSHVHWCHQWNTAYLYGEEEIEGLRALFGELGLRVLDLHGLVLDPLYYAEAGAAAREQGLAVVVNRIRMTARLGSDTVILHPPEPKGRDCAAVCEGARPFIDRVIEVARPLGVRIAMENLASADTWGVIEWLLDRYDAAALGLCYDSGHGNLFPGGLDRLEKFRDRLI